MFALAASSVRYLALLAGLLLGATTALDLVQYLAILVTGLALLQGTYAFLNRPFPRFWFGIAGIVVVWTVVGSGAQWPLLPLTLPLYGLLTVIHLLAGLAILRSDEFSGRGKSIVGWVFIIWGLHRADYPFIRSIEWLSPWGYILSAVLEIIVAVGMMLIYFDRTRAELEANEQRLAQDASDRRRTEAAEHEQRLLAEALRDTGAALTSALDLPEVLHRILEHIARLVPHDAATIMLVDDGIAHIVDSRGYVERGQLAALAIRFPVAESEKFTSMVASGLPLIIDDVHTDSKWLDMAETRWIRGYLGAPIRVEGQTIGFINLDSATPKVFNARHAETLRIFADQAGIALRNARLYDTLRRQAAELEQRVADRTAELERERAQLWAILDGIGEGVVGMIFGDAPDSIAYRYTNSALHRLIGFTPDEWDTRSVFIGNLPPDQFPATWSDMLNAIASSGLWKTETLVQRKDGSTFEASLTVSQVTGKHGQIEGVVSILRDISQEKALEAQKANFVTSASHELRTPIANLKTRLWLLRQQPERLPQHLEILDQVTNRIQKLVEDLLDLSRFERGVIPLELQRLHLQAFVAELVEVQQVEADQKQLELACSLPPPNLIVKADPDRLNQIITNLITNAIRYTPAGGKIEVRARAADDTTALIEVQDSGIGIAPEHLPHIFEPFYRAHPDGSGMGLGLSISREIAQLHGGDLSVTSQPGEGSCFTLRLPLLQGGTI